MEDKKLYVVGAEAGKSLSPLIFNHWFYKYSINAKYSYKEVQRGDFNESIKKILNEKNLIGLNITIPFKELISKYLSETDNHSRIIGATNCVTVKEKNFYGSNTDWIGYSKSLKEKTTTKDRLNKEAIIIGYGGAGKAVLYALLKLEYKKIHIFNRSKNRLVGLTNKRIETHNITDLKNFINSSSLIVNTIPINILKKLKIERALLSNTAISDVVYQPKETEFLNYFTNPKVKIYGISMLIKQAIPCFKKWFNVEPAVDEKLIEIINKKISK